MIRTSLIPALLLAPAMALAQSPSPGALDLSVPQEPLRYLGDPSYQSDAPGTYYGDHSGRGLPKKDAAGTDVVVDDKLQVHGAVSTGIGYSKAFGNSHWSAVDLNLGKNYTNDEGKTRRFDLNIHLSEGEGVGPGYGYGRGYGPGPWYGW
jgi:hypothetical protein